MMSVQPDGAITLTSGGTGFRKVRGAYLAGQGDLCIVGVAQQLRLLLPQHQRLLDEGRVVRVPRGRPRDEGPVQLLPQRPAVTLPQP